MTVPGNKIQKRFIDLQRLRKRPSYGVENSAEGLLVKVIDAETETIPTQLNRAIARNPGVIYGLVQVDNGAELYLAFAESADSLYTIYGDANLLTGIRVKIIYHDSKINSGKIYLLPGKGALKNIQRTTVIFDIGDIL